MAPVRTHAPPRRRSSVATLAALASIKSGNYYQPPQSRPVTFAPNVTPTSFLEDAEDDDDEFAVATLFPPAAEGDDEDASSTSANASKKRPASASRRRSVGHIPRPPNAFMLFRADFVRMKHVPGSVETTHGSLSKIIGNCWRQLPLEEKRVWEIKAKHAKAEHKARYPGYRFRPVHNKAKRAERAAAAATKPTMSVEEDRRCEEVAALLLQGKKGHALTEAVRALDARPPSATLAPPSFDWQQQQQHFAAQRRPSSVPPLPTQPFMHPGMFQQQQQQQQGQGAIALPSVPFFAPLASRPTSPGPSSRALLGARRTSSVPPALPRSWLAPEVPLFTQQQQPYAHEPSPLPEANTALFEPSFFDASFGFANPFTSAMSASSMPPPAAPLEHALSPLDPLAPMHDYPTFDPSAFGYAASSASPAPSDGSLSSGHMAQLSIHEPVEQQQQQVPLLAAPTPLRAPSFAALEQEHVLYAPFADPSGGVTIAPGVYDLGAFDLGGLYVPQQQQQQQPYFASAKCTPEPAFFAVAPQFNMGEFMHEF